ncbi:MAG: NAD(P)/FAD-dependent oxidoreductase [Armatimonadota bacterium]
MPHYRYFIIGGGMTADAAVKAIRKIDGNGSIGLISSETVPPYKRPALSKALWKGKPVESIWLKTAEHGVEMHLGRTAVILDARNKRLVDDEATEYTFEKLLLATGGTPRMLPFESDGIIYYRTFGDYENLRAQVDGREHFAVIGGGFIGSEVAAALAMNDKKVTMLFPEDSIGQRVYPRDISAHLNDYYRAKGVEIMERDTVVEVEHRGEKIVLKTQGGAEVVVHGVVAGIGIVPNTELAQSAGLKITNGIHVDDLLRTNHQDIYAAGDVADFYNGDLARHMRVEHEDNAVTMGEYAGRNMAGEVDPYHYLPYFYSDLFELGYEAVGELDSGLETFADWKEPFKEGVVYYLKEGRVRGVLLWNVWDKVPAARELIAEPGPFGPDNLAGRIM